MDISSTRTRHKTKLTVSSESKILGCCMQGSLSKEINVDSDCLQPFPFHAMTDDFFLCTESVMHTARLDSMWTHYTCSVSVFNTVLIGCPCNSCPTESEVWKMCCSVPGWILPKRKKYLLLQLMAVSQEKYIN